MFYSAGGTAPTIGIVGTVLGLVLSFNDNLTKIGEIIKQSTVRDSYIRVEGHTDSVPMNGEFYKSNWYLSAMRSSNVAQILINKAGVKADKVSATGYGEYSPKADNSTDEGKSTNRRVDILIMNSKFNELENNKE
jgi:chemotaxis protein MotB